MRELGLSGARRGQASKVTTRPDDRQRQPDAHDAAGRNRRRRGSRYLVYQPERETGPARAGAQAAGSARPRGRASLRSESGRLPGSPDLRGRSRHRRDLRQSRNSSAVDAMLSMPTRSCGWRSKGQLRSPARRPRNSPRRRRRDSQLSHGASWLRCACFSRTSITGSTASSFGVSPQMTCQPWPPGSGRATDALRTRRGGRVAPTRPRCQPPHPPGASKPPGSSRSALERRGE